MYRGSFFSLFRRPCSCLVTFFPAPLIDLSSALPKPICSPVCLVCLSLARSLPRLPSPFALTDPCCDLSYCLRPLVWSVPCLGTSARGLFFLNLPMFTLPPVEILPSALAC
ncbi:hypothetical protein O6H91_22G071300 [Diphasiastrum complanatum]|uniref:Uncharacterized protein n=1 Tax=Diphasiastrum complanatum TaxID=34168 RepID=A0ACC2AGV3_DIPCM|nr:hypothetical protein O6H91_22G071300 [Diphasiastrum complanatum]